MTRSSGPPDHVVVIGGGLTGLVAAYRLSSAGVHVTLVEPGPLGGKLQTSVVAGRPVDEGADAFLLRVPWAFALCRDLGLDGELVSPSERSAHVFVDSTRHPLPGGHVLGVPTDLDALAASGLVTPDGVERARRDLSAPADAADPHLAGHDVALGPYLRRRLGDEVVDHLIDPLLGGINAGDTTTMSLAAVVPQLDAAARSGDPSLIRSCIAQRDRTTTPSATPPPIFATPMGGMAQLVDALVHRIPAVDICHGRRVDAIELVGQPATTARVVLDDDRTIDADAVIVTTPAHVTGPLLTPLLPAVGTTYQAIDHTSVAMVTMAFPRAALGDTTGASGCLVPRDQGLVVTATSYATSKWAHLRDPARDDVILRTSVGRSGDVRHQGLDDTDLTERVLADLDRILGVTGPPTETRIGRWDRCLPQYAPGHLDRIAAADVALASTPVRVAGMATRGVGIPACVRSAEDAVSGLGV